MQRRVRGGSTRVEGAGRVALAGQTLAVADMRQDLSPGAAVEVGLRPEDVRAGTSGAGLASTAT